MRWCSKKPLRVCRIQVGFLGPIKGSQRGPLTKIRQSATAISFGVFPRTRVGKVYILSSDRLLSPSLPFIITLPPSLSLSLTSYYSLHFFPLLSRARPTMSRFTKSVLALLTLALVCLVTLSTVKADQTEEQKSYGTVIGIGKWYPLSP